MRARSITSVVVTGALLLGACAGDSDEEPPPDAQASSPVASASAHSGSTGQPVLDDDFPDPDVLDAADTYYAYGTNANALNVRVAQSTDLVTWTLAESDALPQLPPWVIKGKTWAPEVARFGPHRYVMYFTATNFQPALQCIGVATAKSPEGPFRVVGKRMLVCPGKLGGAIDAATFTDDDGKRYLLWKNDGNCCGKDTWIFLAPLSRDGLRLAGPRRRLIKQTLAWEGALVEAPTLWKHDGTYVLMYSANDYSGERYAIGYATAPSIEGPYTKSESPLLSTESSNGRFIGPGGQDVVTGPDGKDWLVFHDWDEAISYRGMNAVPLEWKDGKPVPVLE